MSQLDFRHHFLIAMPAMADSHFAKTLVYICEHNEQGALGIIVNRPTNLTLGELFDQTKIPVSEFKLSGMPVYFGGPVQTDRGFVLH